MPSGRGGAWHFWTKEGGLGLKGSLWKIRDKHKSVAPRGKMFEQNAPITPGT